MKIAFDANELTKEYCGLGKTQVDLMTAIHKNFPDIDIIVFHNKKWKIRETLPFKFKTMRYRNNKFSQLWLAFRLWITRVDIVYWHCNGGILPYFKNFKNVIMIHDVLPLEMPGHFTIDRHRQIYIDKTQSDIDHAHMIFTVSDYSRNQILKNFSVKCPVITLYNGISQNTFAPSTSRGEYYLYVGGYHQRKGLHQMLGDFIKDGKRKLIMVGKVYRYSDEFSKLAQTAIEMGILTELGYISEEELHTLISNAHALIYPSKYEGFGLPPLEAMRVGTPVITTNFTCIPEICGDAAIYCDPDIPGDLNRAITELETNQNLSQQLIERGYKNLRRFDIDQIVEIFIKKLKEVK